MIELFFVASTCAASAWLLASGYHGARHREADRKIAALELEVAARKTAMLSDASLIAALKDGNEELRHALACILNGEALSVLMAQDSAEALRLVPTRGVH